MRTSEETRHLSKITTDWSLLRAAHGAAADAAQAAQRLLLERYGRPVRRFLARVVADEADDLFQEFAMALLGGGLRGADPKRGRFRDYVKATLRHLAGRHGRRNRGRAAGVDLAEIASPSSENGAFDADWRATLQARAWDALAQAQPLYHAVLRYRAEHDEASSTEMAAALSAALGRPLSADAVRQTLHRARRQYAFLLADEVAHSLAEPSRQALEEELAELRLLEYCRPALEHWR